MYTKEQFDDAASRWLVRHRATEDPATLSKILTRTRDNLDRLGGYPAPSAFERAYLELTASGAIKPFRGSLMDKPAEAPAIPPEVVTWIESPRTSVRELRLRYRNDPAFGQQYDAYEKTKGQRPEQQPAVVSLTVEEYHRTPAA